MYYIVNRTTFPTSDEVANLYVKCCPAATINSDRDAVQVNFEQGGTISTNTYFNSFYESFYAKYTKLESVYYLLKLDGDFQVSVYRETRDGSKEILSQSTFNQCQDTDYIKISLPELQQRNSIQGRIYFELQCLSERGAFKEGIIVTEMPPLQKISLAIISCTFKKETYIKKTVDTILQDRLLSQKSWQIFVVDNAKTLSENDFPAAEVQLILNRNVGGSGGFTKGMVSALQSNTYTHLLLMDDDIVLEPESIYRLFSVYEYANEDCAIAGSMLDLYKRHMLYEAGAAYDTDPQSLEPAPFQVAPLKHNLELQKTESLNCLLSEDDIDYGGFWFFAFPSKFVEEIGFLLPFFIKIDDMEFGIRIKQQLGKKIVAFPSIAVWHEPFYSKVIIWDRYYYARNNLIARTIYGTIEYFNTFAEFSRDFISSLLIFEYNHAEMVVRAFEDYLKGPNFLKKISPEELHKEIVDLSKSYKTQVLQQNHCLDIQTAPPKAKAKTWQKLFSLLTLNGHLLPNFIKSDGEVFLWQSSTHAGAISRGFRKKKVIVYKESNSCLLQNEIDRATGINLLSRWLRVTIEMSLCWSDINKQWKDSATELTSTYFWQRYLNLEKSN